MYLNGQLHREAEVRSNHLTIWDRAKHTLVIGNAATNSRMAWTDKYFDGLVDEVKVWNRSLSAKDIAELYAADADAVARSKTAVEARKVFEAQ